MENKSDKELTIEIVKAAIEASVRDDTGFLEFGQIPSLIKDVYQAIHEIGNSD